VKRASTSLSDFGATVTSPQGLWQLDLDEPVLSHYHRLEGDIPCYYPHRWEVGEGGGSGSSCWSCLLVVLPLEDVHRATLFQLRPKWT